MVDVTGFILLAEIIAAFGETDTEIRPVGCYHAGINVMPGN